jgi:hypothetical protein
MIKVVSIAGSLISCFMLALLVGFFEGFDEGMAESSGFSIAGESGNQFLVRFYTYILLSMSAFVLVSFINNRPISVVLRIMTLILSFICYWFVIQQKIFIYYLLTKVINETLPFDIAVVIICSLLLIFQMFEVIGLLANKRRKEIGAEPAVLQ